MNRKHNRTFATASVAVVVLVLIVSTLTYFPVHGQTLSSNPIDISFSSLTGFTYIYAPNYRSSEGPIQVQVPQNMQVNMVWFKLSDRAYDPNNITLYFEDSGGNTLASGVLPEWGPYGYDGDFVYPVQLSNVITLQVGTRYQMAFSQLSAEDGYGGITQDIFQTQVLVPDTGYLGQTVWPVFELGLMHLNPTSSGLANHNYGSYTDFTNSPGYKGNSEVGLRFFAAQNEQMVSFEVATIRTDGTSNPLVFTLRNSLTNAANGKPYPAPLSVQPPLAKATITANQVAANLTSNSGTVSGQSTFVKVHLDAPLVGGRYYWIVMAAPNGDQPVILGRLVNPYRDLVGVSPTDFSNGDWGVPQDGPSDLSFRITTTGQSIVNTIYSQPLNENAQGVAQSFTPSSTTQIKGVWTTGLQTGGRSVTISVQTLSSSAETPSGAVLTQTTITQGGFGGETYVGLPTITLNAGVKYWLVYSVGSCVSVLCSNPFVLPALEYRPDYYNSIYDFQGSSSHFEYLAGETWNTDPNLGDIDFAFVSPTGSEPISTSSSTLSHSSSAETSSQIFNTQSRTSYVTSSSDVTSPSYVTTTSSRMSTGEIVDIASTYLAIFAVAVAAVALFIGRSRIWRALQRRFIWLTERMDRRCRKAGPTDATTSATK